MKPGDRVRVTGRKHPWKGAAGEILRPYERYAQSGLDWLLRLDPPHGLESYGRNACSRSADLELESAGADQVTLW